MQIQSHTIQMFYVNAQKMLKTRKWSDSNLFSPPSYHTLLVQIITRHYYWYWYYTLENASYLLEMRPQTNAKVEHVLELEERVYVFVAPFLTRHFAFELLGVLDVGQLIWEPYHSCTHILGSLWVFPCQDY